MQFLTLCIAVVPCMMLANIEVQDEKINHIKQESVAIVVQQIVVVLP